jgi:hypothetical protein
MCIVTNLHSPALFFSHEDLMLVQINLFFLFLFGSFAYFLPVEHRYGMVLQLVHKLLLTLFFFLLELDLFSLFTGVTLGVQMVGDVQ